MCIKKSNAKVKKTDVTFKNQRKNKDSNSTLLSSKTILHENKFILPWSMTSNRNPYYTKFTEFSEH